MAPLATYDPPHVQLGRLMVEARREGLSFDDFWQRAVRPRDTLVMVTHPDPPDGCVRWPTDRNDRITWQAAIRDARAGWQRAYDREERTSPERALATLADEISAIATISELAARQDEAVALRAVA